MGEHISRYVSIYFVARGNLWIDWMWMVKETGFGWRNRGHEGAPYQIRKREGGADEEKQQNVPGLSPVAPEHEKTG